MVRRPHPTCAYVRHEAARRVGPADDSREVEASPWRIGPVEYIIVGFPGNQFNGEIAPELGKLVDSGTIRILDLVFITKDADGNVAAVEFEDHDDVALFNALEGEVGGLDQRRGHRVRRRRARAELLGRPAHLGGRLGDAVRRGACATRVAC